MPENTDEPDLITVKAAADRLSLTPWSVYKLLDEAKLQGKYQGRRRYVLTASLKKYVKDLSDMPAAS